MSTDIATHDAPVWRTKANFLIVANLTEYGMSGQWEQIWAKQIREDEFEICCIPYFTYGLALGDIVRTSSSAGKSHVIAEVVKSSGRSLLRFWLKNGNCDGKERIHQYLVDRSPLHEWSSENLLAVDLPEEDQDARQELHLLAEDLRQYGIESEWGH